MLLFDPSTQFNPCSGWVLVVVVVVVYCGHMMPLRQMTPPSKHQQISEVIHFNDAKTQNAKNERVEKEEKTKKAKTLKYLSQLTKLQREQLYNRINRIFANTHTTTAIFVSNPLKLI